MLEYRLLGPVELVADGEVVPLRAAKPRALLAILLLSRNRVVSLDRIVDELWSEEPPETAIKAAQVYVSQLRKLLGDRLERRAPGYVLRVDESEVDADRFEALLARSGEERERGDVAATLEEALALWRGPALGEFAEAPFAAAEAARLEELRLTAVERRLEVELELGRHGAVVPELERIVRDHPLRERPHEQLMLALYRSGRQADALAVYRALRERLAEELGLTPSPALRELERRILQQDPELEAARPASSSATAAAPERGPRPWIAVLAAAVLVVAGAAVAIVLTGGDGTATPAAQQRPTPEAGLRPFVLKLENFLAQSRAGRSEVVRIVQLAQSCKLSPAQALSRLDLVERNRQSLLQQSAALSVPEDESAVLASDRFQKAIQASMASDLLYRRWLGVRRPCVLGPPPAAGAADAAKRAFVAAFNPLARRYSQRAWKPGEF